MESYENFRNLIPTHEPLSLKKIDQLYQIVRDAYDEGLRTYEFDNSLYLTDNFVAYNRLGYLVDSIQEEVYLNGEFELITILRDKYSHIEICRRYYRNGEIAENVDDDPENWRLYMMKVEDSSDDFGNDYLKKV